MPLRLSQSEGGAPIMKENQCRLIKQVQEKYKALYDLLEIEMNLNQRESAAYSRVLQMTGRQIDRMQQLLLKTK